GRNGECPVAILAPCSPGDCFDMVFEAVRIAFRFMTPVFLLSDGYLANGSEPWLIPRIEDLPKISVEHPQQHKGNGNGEHFLPYKRDDRLVRPWAIPGTPGLEHRIGGLEKEDVTGNVNYEPLNHEKMVRIRAAKIDAIVQDVPNVLPSGDPEGDLLLVSW